MSDNSKIEWNDATWNPIIGCSKCSPGCDHCYAERMACRLSAMGKKGYSQVITGNHWNGTTTLIEEALDIPTRWKRPRKIFVCSMGDLFHESVSMLDILDVMQRIRRCKQHTFLILTKRPWHINEYLLFAKKVHTLPQNLWVGTTVCNQYEAELKIPYLLKIPAAVRFVSIEPMLGKINLDNGETSWLTCKNRNKPTVYNASQSSPIGFVCCQSFMVYGDHFHGIDWVICGGESGPGARPMHPDWVRSLKNQCEFANIPFLFKQWGEWAPENDYTRAYLTNAKSLVYIKPTGEVVKTGTYGAALNKNQLINRVGKKNAGRLLDGKLFDQYPEV